MNSIRSYIIVTIIVAVLLCIFAGCSTPATEVSQPDKSAITEGVMTTSVDNDSKPTSAVSTVFAPDTPVIYCSFKVSGVTEEDLIKASWYYITGETVGKDNELLDEIYTSAQGGQEAYYLAFYKHMPAGGWYKGSYKVVLYVNNTEKLTVPFDVK
ncbi:MAG: hypothetical protein PHU70_01330 [Dehalococcoidia bacterium]|nr:hypothetical protein [Dehalococcoidia bacterium]